MTLSNDEQAVLRRLVAGQTIIHAGPFGRPEGWSYRWGFFRAVNEAESKRLEHAITSLLRKGYISPRPNVSDAAIFEITELGSEALTE